MTLPQASTNTPGLPPSVLTDTDRANVEAALRASRSAHTRRTYAGAWRRFEAWCSERSAVALPASPELVAAYLAERHQEGVATSTLTVARSAVRERHISAQLPDPTAHEGVSRTFAGLARQNAGRPVRQAAPLTAEAVAAITATTPDTHAGRRDLALVRVMRDGMLRRSEAAAIRWEDIATQPDGTGRLRVPVSKSDQLGAGAVLYLGKGTLEALEALTPSTERDPAATVFGLSERSIGRRLAAMAKRAGLGDGYSGHSARIGMAVDLARIGVELPALMAAGRWNAPAMPARYTSAESAGRGAVARWYDAGNG